jgi:hypothetical protein
LGNRERISLGEAWRDAGFGLLYVLRRLLKAMLRLTTLTLLLVISIYTIGVNSHIPSQTDAITAYSILDAIKEAADKLRKVGGKDLVITGDLFHTRGNVKPSVLNPTLDLFSDLICYGNRRS